MRIDNQSRNTSAIEEFFYQKIYWLNQLDGELPETNFMTDYVRPAIYEDKNQSISFELSSDLSEAIIQFTKNSNLSIYLVLLSALSILSQKYTGNNDVIIGSPTYKLEGIDDCSNIIVPLRLNVMSQLTFQDFLLQVKDTLLGAYSHQNHSFDELVRLFKLPQNQNRCPIFDLVILLENIHNSNSLAGLKNDLTISFKVIDNSITGKIVYRQDIFKEDTIKYIIKYYINILKSVFNNFHIKIAEIPLLRENDRQQLLNIFNDNAKQYPLNQTLDKLFENQVFQTPEKIAVVFENTQVTYQTLNEKANQLARFLWDLGVRKGEFVGILKERDVNFLVGMLAIYKVGGVYVPIDSTYPQDRIKYMVSNSEVKILLTDSSCLNILTGLLENCPQLKSLICLDAKPNDGKISPIANVNIYTQLDFSNDSKENLGESNVGTDPAYMLYTSGSTGFPKGAIVRHDSAINHIYAQYDALNLTEELCFLQSAPSSTDISVWQFIAPLLIGGKTVIVDIESSFVPDKLFKVIKEKRITAVELVPTVFRGLLDYISQLSTHQRLLPDLKWMMLSGESVSVKWVNQWLTIYPLIRIANVYGPTEAADDITVFIVDKPLPENQRTIPIGKPLANLNLYILDAQMQLVPIGVPGEICVSGIGVGNGYWKNEEKTKLSFVSNLFPNTTKKLPESNKDFIYKTGDLGRWLPDGNIEFLGRIDNQVKIRGFRVELGEIEALLSQHPNVRESVVVVRENNNGDKYLVTYVVPKEVQMLHEDMDESRSNQDSASSQLKSQLRNFLRERLPQYMVPSAFILLESMPLAPSGKIDLRALPAPSGQPEELDNYVAPRTPIEEMLAGIWAQVLQVELVGVCDNFFTLGGHSLLATLVISRVRATFAVDLSLRSLFKQPTVAALAQSIAEALRSGQSRQEDPILPIAAQDGWAPLSFAQSRIWFLHQLEPNISFYNLSVGLQIVGELNIAALVYSFNCIIKRHEALRTNFVIQQGQPMQVIHPAVNLTVPVVDLCSLPETERKITIQGLATAEAAQRFDLATEALVRATLLKLNEAEHVLLLTTNHIVSDGWSMGILLQELIVFYEAYSTNKSTTLPQLPIQYTDFTHWQHKWLQQEGLQSQLAYWKKQLEGAPTLLELPTDRPPLAAQTFQGAYQFIPFPQQLSKLLNTLSQKEDVTLFMTLLAAFKTLLWRYTGQNDICVGTPIANRNRAEIEGLIGSFANILVLRTDLGGNLSFRQLLKRVREVALGAYAHQDLPFEQLVQQLQPTRSLSHSPLFQVMFALPNTPMPSLELPGLTISPLVQENSTMSLDLTLFVEATAEGFRWIYNTDLFDAATITRMARHFQTLLEGIVANPNQKLSKLPLLTDAEQQQLLVEWNNTTADYPKQLCIHQLFEAQVEQTPDAVAVVFEDEMLTYRELNCRANQLAHYLRSVGVGAEVLVGLCVERSIQMVVGLLGILKAGGAYIPLDPAYPTERIDFILSDAQVSVLLTDSSFFQKEEEQYQVICLDTDTENINSQSAVNPVPSATAENLAYVIYTSGSTGKPKGVQIQHTAVVNLLISMQRQPGLTAKDVLLAVTTITFDMAVPDLYLPLITGARIVLVRPEVAKDGNLLRAQIAAAGATIMQGTPATFRMLLAAGLSDLRGVKILCGGEALPSDLMQQLLETGAGIWNMYGPTETTVWSTVFFGAMQSSYSTIPIGRPIANTEIYLLDDHLQPVPIGVPGELHIGGVGLARGYVNLRELTTEKFIPHPFSSVPGARLYKTGDLARYLKDGNIEYLGRIDHQVKIRGFRIELGEIEAAIAQHKDVGETVVIVREDVSSDKRLVAYIVPHQSGAVPTNTELRSFLKQKLPDYMVPGAFVMLSALPLTPNGKVDRRSLPVPSFNSSLDSFVAPRDKLEQQLTQIWSEVLKIERVGVRDNFFELGGHSLLGVRLMAQIEQQFGKNLPLATLFQSSTVEQLATTLRMYSDSSVVWSPLVAIQPNGSKQPFFCVPGVGGNVFYFYDLARHLGPDQPFYGLQTLGVDGKSQPHTRMEDIAADCIQAIQTVQPQGPYLLGGHSFGGKVAFEIGQQLQKQGHEVALLALLDIPAPVPDTKPLDVDWDNTSYLIELVKILEDMFGKNLEMSYDDLQPLTTDEQLNYLLKQMKMANIPLSEVGITQMRGFVQVFKANYQVNYVPQEVYPSQITLFRVNEADEEFVDMVPSEILQDLAWGWGKFSAEPVEIHFIPGNHRTMMTEPHVRVLAEQMGACIKQAQADD